MWKRLEKFLFRMWFYFRKGYGMYISFPFSVLGFATSIYYLAIQNNPGLQIYVPNFMICLVIIALVGAPLAMFIGWLHMKRLHGYASEVDISVESNPYNYKIPPGISTEISWPITLLYMKMWQAMLESTDALTPELEEQLNTMNKSIESLLRGEVLKSAPAGLRVLGKSPERNNEGDRN